MSVEESQVRGSAEAETQKRNRAADIRTDLCVHDGQLANNCPAFPSNRERGKCNHCEALTADPLIDGTSQMPG